VSGSQGRFDANAAMRGAIGDAHGYLGFGRRQDDIQPGRDDQSGARANRWDGTGKMHWLLGERGATLDVSALGVREDQRWQSGQLYFFSNNDQGDARATFTTPLDASGAHRVGVTGYYSRFNHLSRQATLPEPVSDSGDASRESLARMELTYNGELSANQLVDAGMDVDRDALSTGRIIGGHRAQSSIEPYAQYTLNAGHLSFVPGARLSYSDQWGTHFTPKLATLYHLTDQWSLRASVGAGYRAPEFKELYITFLNGAVGYVVHGNPALRPESSTNGTVGLEWRGSKTYARVQGYANRFSNFIESVQAPDSGGVEQFTYGNIASGVTRGVDVDAGWAYRALSLDGSVGYLNAYDRSTRLPLLGTTPRSARLTGDLRLPMRVHASVTGLYWSKAAASQESVGAETITLYRAAFSRLDARIARTFAPGVDVQAGVQNLFDARPVDWPGNVDRRWYVGLSVDRGF
jgi:outer membrane receptor for ferrienterochelin and colicins